MECKRIGIDPSGTIGIPRASFWPKRIPYCHKKQTLISTRAMGNLITLHDIPATIGFLGMVVPNGEGCDTVASIIERMEENALANYDFIPQEDIHKLDPSYTEATMQDPEWHGQLHQTKAQLDELLQEVSDHVLVKEGFLMTENANTPQGTSMHVLSLFIWDKDLTPEQLDTAVTTAKSAWATVVEDTHFHHFFVESGQKDSMTVYYPAEETNHTPAIKKVFRFNKATGIDSV